MKQMQSNVGVTRRKPKKKPKVSSGDYSHGRPLYNGFWKAFEQWQAAGQVPSENQIRKQLQEIWKANPEKASSPPAAEQPNRSTKAAAKHVDHIKSEPGTWADLVNFTDDDASTSITSKPNILLRLTLAKDFADQALASQLVGKPHFLQAVAFNESLRKAVAQTRGAVDCEHEATCLISVRAEDVQKFLQASLPTGIFLNQRKGSSVPHWFHKHSQSNSEYYVQIIKTCKSRSVVA